MTQIYDTLFADELAKITPEQRKEMEMSYQVAERIDTLLKEKGMTKQELAERLHKKPSAISAWLSGRHNFTTRTLVQISCALGHDIITIS